MFLAVEVLRLASSLGASKQQFNKFVTEQSLNQKIQATKDK